MAARVVVLVHAVAEAHEANALFLVLHAVHEVGSVTIVVVLDILKHLQNGLVSATVQRARQCVDATGDGNEQVGLRRADHADGGGGAVLLVVSVEDEELVQSLGHNRVNLVLLSRVTKHHAQEVLARVELVIRVHIRLALRRTVGISGQHRDLSQQADSSLVQLLLIQWVELILVVSGENVKGGGQHGHRVRIAREDVEGGLKVLIQESVVANLSVELRQLVLSRQVALNQQVGHLVKGGVLSQIRDVITTVAENAFLTINKGDLGLGGTGRCITRVEGHQASLVTELANIEAGVTLRGLLNVHLVLAAGVLQYNLVLFRSHVFSFPQCSTPTKAGATDLNLFTL